MFDLDELKVANELERLERENARLRRTIDMLGKLDRLLVEGVTLEVERVDNRSYGIASRLTFVQDERKVIHERGCGNSLDEALWRLANPNEDWGNW